VTTGESARLIPAGLFVTLGDSITAGTPGDTIDLWPQLVTDWLARQSLRVRHLDLAFDGATSTDVLERQLPHALDCSPYLVTVICGANDILLYPRPDLVGMAANIEEVLSRLAEHAHRPRIITATYPDFAPLLAWHPRSKARVIAGLAHLNDLIRDASLRADALCVDLAQAAPSHGVDAFAPDGVHPSEIGHRRIAAAMIRSLAKVLSLPVPHRYAREHV
jgi:lysophospholipase L1-like esterase